MTNNVKKYIKEICLIFLASFLAAIATKYFVSKLKLLSGGIYGLSLLLTRLKGSSISSAFDLVYFGEIYILLNIPLIIFAWFKLGKKLVVYTSIQVLIFSTMIKYLPDSNILSNTSDTLTAVIIAGIFFGISGTLTYKGNSSTGGLDIIVIWLTKKFQNLSVGNLNSIHTYILYIIAQISLRNKFGTRLIDEILIYSIIFRYVAALVVNTTFPRHNIILCTIIVKRNEDNIFKVLNELFPHKGYSVYHVVGKSGKKRKSIDIAMSYYESKDLIKLLKEKNIDNFFYTQKILRAHKDFTAIK